MTISKTLANSKKAPSVWNSCHMMCRCNPGELWRSLTHATLSYERPWPRNLKSLPQSRFLDRQPWAQIRLGLMNRPQRIHHTPLSTPSARRVALDSLSCRLNNVCKNRTQKIEQFLSLWKDLLRRSGAPCEMRWAKVKSQVVVWRRSRKTNTIWVTLTTQTMTTVKRRLKNKTHRLRRVSVRSERRAIFQKT